MRIITKGATSQTVYFDLLDSSSTTGGRKTGLAYNTSGLTAYYVRSGASPTAITLATLAAANSAWSSGGFKEVDATNMPGLYRLDIPDAALATGAGDSVVVTLKGTGVVQASMAIQLASFDLQSSFDFAKGSVAMTESYAANGAQPTPIQALYAIHQMLMSFAISGTSQTVRKLDNSTTAFTATLNDGTNPTAISR